MTESPDSQNATATVATTATATRITVVATGLIPREPPFPRII
jgi:hypothetical protein